MKLNDRPLRSTGPQFPFADLPLICLVFAEIARATPPLSVREREIVITQLCVFLFQFALGFVPAALNCSFVIAINVSCAAPRCVALSIKEIRAPSVIRGCLRFA